MENKQITLRLPERLHKQVKLAAERKGISINEEILFRIAPVHPVSVNNQNILNVGGE